MSYLCDNYMMYMIYAIFVGPANTEPYGMCDEGWFCPTNNSLAQTPGNKCLAGHRCPQGSAQQQPCPSGYYQDLEEQGDCNLCPAGT